MKHALQKDVTQKQHKPWLAGAYLVLACWLLMLFGVSSTQAQEEEAWAPPFLLSQDISDERGAPAKMAFPILVADDWGDVHSFWPVQKKEQTGNIGDTIFYARWNGTNWSNPTDIIYLPGEVIAGVRAVVDSHGWLHLVWTTGYQGPVWYSRAPVTEAGSPLAWSSPMQVTDDVVTGLTLEIDAQDNLHLVHCALGANKGIYHTSSVGGEAWSAPNLIWTSGELVDYGIECYARVAVDDRNRLHAVWGQAGLNSPRVYYARSEDGGTTWRPAVEIDTRDSRYWENYGPTLANVAAIGADEIHVVWDGAPAGQRWHQWSADGGNTWNPPRQISPDLRGLTDQAIMVADSLGTLHLVSQGLENTGPFYASWREGRWSPFTLIDERQDTEQRANLALARGNILHVAWDSKSFTEIWTSRLHIDAPAVPPKPRPTQSASPAVQVASTPAVVVASPASNQRESTPQIGIEAIAQDTHLGVAQPGQQAFLAGVLPAALLLALVILTQWMRRHN